MKKLMLTVFSMLVSSILYSAPVTYIIAEDPDDGDYTSLSAAINDNERDITGVDGGTVTFRIEGVWTSSDTTRVVCDGFTTGPSSGVVVTTVGDARHGGKWTNTAYRLSPNDNWGGPCVTIQCDYFVLDGVQASLPSGDDNHPIVRVLAKDFGYETSGVIIKNNILCIKGEYTSTSSYGRSGIVFNDAAGGYIINNIIYNNQTGINMSYYGHMYLLNNTVYGNTVGGIKEGVEGYYRDVHLRNNVSVNNGSTDYSGVFKSSATDISSDNTSPYVAGRSKTITFESASTGDFMPASTETDLIDQGTDLSSTFGFSVDNKGTSRPQGSAWDIGALEYATSEEEDMLPSECAQILIFQ